MHRSLITGSQLLDTVASGSGDEGWAVLTSAPAGGDPGDSRTRTLEPGEQRATPRTAVTSGSRQSVQPLQPGLAVTLLAKLGVKDHLFPSACPPWAVTEWEVRGR